ncbi:LIRA2 protein, partial [Anseranas semipalmata]|nr:LIRA2 protein [Anseranas semipalmata]
MAPAVVALILSWCLVARSRAQHLPRPFLSLRPSHGVALGDNVTLRCHLPRPAAWVLFYQDEHSRSYRSKSKKQDTAEFSFGDTMREHAGTYRCQYEVSGQQSEMSDPVELVVTGE